MNADLFLHAAPPSPPLPAYLDVVDGVARCRVDGPVTLVDGVDQVTAAILYCRAHKLPRLLIDIRGAQLKMPPTLTDRFWMAQDWGQAAQGQLEAAMVTRPEYLDPNRFGVKACIDAGLVCDVFLTVDEALAWLRRAPPPVAGGANDR